MPSFQSGVKSGCLIADDRSPYRTLSLDQGYAIASGPVHHYLEDSQQARLGMPAAAQFGGPARGEVSSMALPLSWMHDRYARALAQTARLRHPGATKEQIKEGVSRALRINSKAMPRVPEDVIKALVDKVVDRRATVNKKISEAVAEQVSHAPKQNDINVARQVLSKLIKGRLQFNASQAAAGRGDGKSAAPKGAKGGPEKPKGGARPHGKGEGKKEGGAKQNKKNKKNDDKKKKTKKDGAAAAAPAQGGALVATAAPGKNKQSGSKKKEEAKELKKQKQAKKAMQEEVSRLTRSPRLTFSERIAFPECDEGFLKSHSGGTKRNKKGGAGKAKKISLLPRLVELLYHGGLHQGRRLANPVRLDDLRHGNPAHILRFYNDGKSQRMKFILDFLTVNYYRLIRAGMSMETVTEKIVIRDLVKIASRENPKVYEATQKILFSKISGEYRRRTQDVEKDEAMPKVSIEGKMADMHTETLMGVDNERFNAWMERNAYAFGFHHRLLKDFYFEGRTSMVEFVLQHMHTHELLVKWVDGKEENKTRHYDISRKLVLSMVKEMQLTLINSMFGTVYSMLADVLVAMHVPSHDVVLANFVNLFLRICTLGPDDSEGFVSLAKDRKVFGGVLKAMLPPTEKEGLRPALTGERAMADARAIEARILTHRIGTSDLGQFLADRDFQAKAIAPERAQMYKHFIVQLTDARVREVRMEPFKPFVPKLQGPEARAAEENVPGDYKQVASRIFREYSARFIEAGIKKLTEELRTEAPLLDVLEHKHGYDGIIHRLGTLGGWIKDVGVDRAREAMGVPFLNEQGFVPWPLADAGLELEGGAKIDCAQFMADRNKRIAKLMGFVPPANTRSYAQPNGRYWPLEFGFPMLISEMNKHADELRAKKAAVREHRQERKARSEAMVALMESRKAKRAVAGEERKLAKLKKQEEEKKKKGAKEKEGKDGAKKSEKKAKKKKNNKKTKHEGEKTEKAEAGVGPQVHAVLAALDQERRERREAEEEQEEMAGAGKIEDASELSSSEDEAAVEEGIPTSAPEVQIVPEAVEPTEDLTATTQMINEMQDGKGGERAQSPTNVEDLFAKA